MSEFSLSVLFYGGLPNIEFKNHLQLQIYRKNFKVLVNQKLNLYSTSIIYFF